MKTKLIIEQHFHGAFGIDFNTASVDDILYLSKEILKYGIGGIFPTIVTDSVENTKKAIAIIKEASQKQAPDMAKILGIHLEGIFLNEKKKGIHNPKYFLKPTIENYKLIEDDFIKIVTLAPELCMPTRPLREREELLDEQSEFSNSGEGYSNLLEYLNFKNIKIQAGHCIGGDLTGCTGVTHMFNAMEGISHRGNSTTLSALINDNIYTEIIADGIHVSYEALKLVFKTKPLDKIILISDCLPCTGVIARSEATKQSSLFEFTFADETVYYDGTKATSKDGTIAGSTMLLPDMIKRLDQIGLFNAEYINNPYKYHNIDLDGSIEWDDDFNIINIIS